MPKEVISQLGWVKAFKSGKIDFHAWIAFLLGVVICVLAISYGEMRKEPSALLVFDVTSTKPGMVKVIFTRDGQLTDLGWAVNFPQGNTRQTASYPLSAGQYDLIGFKPLVEASGRVTIKNLKIISGTGIRNIGEGDFVTINQLDKISAQNGEVVIAPALGANDPFGAFPNLHEIVQKSPYALSSLLWIVAGKIVLIAIFLMLMSGLSGNLPFARGLPDEPRPEPGISPWLGFLAVGLIVLYLRNAHSIFVPVLYAEDGTWITRLIDNGFFDMLFNAKAGYAVFGNVLLLALAQFCNAAFFGHNLTYLPHFVSFFSMLFYAVIAAAPIVLLRSVMRIEARLLLWLLVLLVPLGDSSYEVLGRLANIGFAFPFLAFCLLVWRHYSSKDNCRKQIIATDVMLFLCANTNPLCYLLIGIALGIEAWHHWNSGQRQEVRCWLKKYLTQFNNKSATILLVSLLLMGLWLLLREKVGDGSLGGKFILSNFPEAIIARTFLYPIIFSFYSNLNNLTSSLLLFISIVTIAWFFKGSKRERFTLTSATGVLVVSAIIIIGARPVLTEALDNYQTSFPDRYYYGLTILASLVLTSALSAGFGTGKKSWRRVGANLLAGGLLALYLGNGSFLFEFAKPRFGYLAKATFLDAVKNAYEKGGEIRANGIRYKVALQPAEMDLNASFPEEYIVATVFNVHSLPMAIVEHKIMNPLPMSEAAKNFDGNVVRQIPAGRGREDGWFYVTAGVRSWIPDGLWLKQKNLSPEDVVEISHEEFSAIPDSGVPVK